jgi:hypothetical protein
VGNLIEVLYMCCAGGLMTFGQSSKFQLSLRVCACMCVCVCVCVPLLMRYGPYEHCTNTLRTKHWHCTHILLTLQGWTQALLMMNEVCMLVLFFLLVACSVLLIYASLSLLVASYLLPAACCLLLSLSFFIACALYVTYSHIHHCHNYTH